MKVSHRIDLPRGFFLLFLFGNSLSYSQESTTSQQNPGKPARQQQAFLPSSPVVLPPAVSSLGAEGLPSLGSPEIEVPSSGPGAAAIPVQALPEQIQAPVVSPQEKAEALIQQKVEKPIQPLPLPEETTVMTPTEIIPVPLPGRVTVEPEPKVYAPLILEPVVVTATKTPIPADKVTSSFSVMTGEFLKEHQIRDVSEALRHVVSGNMIQLGGPGRESRFFLRGANKEHTLVLIDGVRVNSPNQGFFDFSSMRTDGIDRIEVIRGPQSTLYGSDAMAGVVNIITRKGEGPPRHSAQVEYGTKNTWYQSLATSAGGRKGDYSISISQGQTDGVSASDEYENLNAVSRFGLSLGEGRLDTTYRFTSARASIDDGAYRPDPNSYSKTRQHLFQTTLQSQLTERWDQKVTGSFFHDRLLSLDVPNRLADSSTSKFRLDADMYSFDWQNNYRLNEANLATGGYQLDHSAVNNKSYDQVIQNNSVYFQDQLSFQEDRWILVGGVRFDHHRAFGSSTNPKFSFMRQWPEHQVKLKGSVGTAFKAPTLNQLFFPNFGNPNLAPEEATGHEIGIEKKFGGGMDVGVNYFYNRFKDMIIFKSIGGSFKPVNIGSAKTEGIEFTAGSDLTEELSVRNFYTFLIAKDLSTGSPLMGRPKHSGGLSLEYRPLEKWGMGLDATFVGKRQDNGPSSVRVTNPGYMKLDLVSSYEYRPGRKFYSKIENLTDSDYDELPGFGTNGTMFTFGSEADF